MAHCGLAGHCLPFCDTEMSVRLFIQKCKVAFFFDFTTEGSGKSVYSSVLQKVTFFEFSL